MRMEVLFTMRKKTVYILQKPLQSIYLHGAIIFSDNHNNPITFATKQAAEQYLQDHFDKDTIKQEGWKVASYK